MPVFGKNIPRFASKKSCLGENAVKSMVPYYYGGTRDETKESG